MDKIKVAIYCRISPFADEFTLTYLCGVQKAVLMETARVLVMKRMMRKTGITVVV